MAMVDPEVPKTPTAASRTLRRRSQDSATHPTDALTPPPSHKKAHQSFTSSSYRDSPSPSKAAHPVSLAKMQTRTHLEGSTMPSPEQIKSMSPEQLRGLANDLVPSLGQARMELAHTKLQFQLLTMETREAAERAEVEHDMTRKEVEVLQAGSPIVQSRAVVSPDPRSTLGQLQQQLETAVLRNQTLEANNAALDRRLKDAKKIIKHLDGKNLELDDSNRMLRDRIKDNREHLNAMRSSGILRSAPTSPRQTGFQHTPKASQSAVYYATPARPRRPEIHRVPATPVSRVVTSITPSTTRPQDDPFGALLFAGEVLDAQHQRSSLPSTPSPTRTMRQPPSHTRGTHSLSSLPVTPGTLRLQQQNAIMPGRDNAITTHNRHHSASTISDSSFEDEGHAGSHINQSQVSVEDELPASQASQAASDLLRRYPGNSSQERPASGAGLIQTKLTGRIVKNNKRNHSGTYEESPKKRMASKRDQQDVGLGIGMWPGPAR